jgi:RimJ/RimL family protein N-acetyltransferase
VDEQQPIVTLRPLVPADAAVIAGWGADRTFAEVADWSQERTLAERSLFQERLILAPPSDLLRWGVTWDDSLIGYVTLRGDLRGRRELGFLIGESSRWGRGLGRAAAAAGLDLAFGDLELDEVWAEAYDAHDRSVRILRGLGMREMGRGAEGRFLGVPTFYRCFAIAADEWRASGPTGPGTR